MTPPKALRLYQLRVDGLPARPDNLAWMVDKGLVYLSPNTKLADPGKGAQLADEQLAREFAAAALPILRKRHGDQVALTIEPSENVPSDAEFARSMARARHDAAVVRARLRERNFAPNQAPLIVAADLT
jgi:hypothetical protein